MCYADFANNQSRYLRLQDNTTEHIKTMLETTRLADVFAAPIGGSMKQCTLELHAQWGWQVTFVYNTTPYILGLMTTNSSFVDLMSRYISQTGDNQYGTIDPVTCGVDATPAQREAFAKATARHHMECLHQVVDEQGTAMLDYAFWYRGRVLLDAASPSEVYSAAVQYRVCEFIAHAKVISETAAYTVTKWSPVERA